MKSANALYGNDVALFYGVSGGLNGILVGRKRNRCTGIIGKPNLGAALGAAVGLTVMPSGMWGMIFRFALWALGEILHAGIVPIDGQLPGDTEPWPTIHALYKRIAIAPILGLE